MDESNDSSDSSSDKPAHQKWKPCKRKKKAQDTIEGHDDVSADTSPVEEVDDELQAIVSW